eukprot:TRINITY_DN4506_c0_g1_i4.p1 TRINITY_DN4506_c0_g1~~TRINITY_DN4506_c0_g1_i4.p1  ORF type:complete len:2236 (+),score=435.24 TRINITY_DN4506_c0_g1_i4:18-6725(+)
MSAPPTLEELKQRAAARAAEQAAKKEVEQTARRETNPAKISQSSSSSISTHSLLSTESLSSLTSTSSSSSLSLIHSRDGVLTALHIEVAAVATIMDRTNKVYILPQTDPAIKKTLNAILPQIITLTEMIRDDLASHIAAMHAPSSKPSSSSKKKTDMPTTPPTLQQIFAKIAGFSKLFGIFSLNLNRVMMCIHRAKQDSPKFSTLMHYAEGKMKADYKHNHLPSTSLPKLGITMEPIDVDDIITQHLQGDFNVNESCLFSDLASLLTVPVRLFPRFVKHLNDLLEVDRSPDVQCLGPFSRPMGVDLAHAKDSCLELYRTLELQYRLAPHGHFDPYEVVESRRLVRDDPLLWILPKKEMSLVRAVLFSDVFILCSKQTLSTSSSHPSGPDSLPSVSFEIRHAEPLVSSRLLVEAPVPLDVAASEAEKVFQLKGKEDTLILQARSALERQFWMQTIASAIDKITNTTTSISSLAFLNSATAAPPSVASFSSTFPPPLTEIVDTEDDEVIREYSQLKNIDRDKVIKMDFPPGLLKLNDISSLLGDLGLYKALNYLALSSLHLVDKIVALSSWLKANTVLTTLLLPSNGIGNRGASRLADAFRFNSTLCVLDLAENKIGDYGCICLMDALLANLSLRSLTLSSNQMTSYGAKAIVNYLRNNYTLGSFDARNNPNMADETTINSIATAILDNYTSPLAQFEFTPAFSDRISGKLKQNHERASGESKAVAPGVVDMGHANIAELDSATLANNHHKITPYTVARIFLDHNQIACIHSNMMSSWMAFRQLISLDLSFNLLTAVPDSLGTLRTLRRLNLSHNMLREFPRFVLGLFHLEGLDLSFNRIDRVPGDISLSSMKTLTTLMLNNNNLSDMPRGLESMSHLSSFSVGGNSLLPVIRQRLYEAWVARVVKLDLSNSDLAVLPPEVGLVISMTYLDVSSNRLRVIPPQIGDLVNLRFLDLSNNKLDSLPYRLNRLTALEYLRIGGNPLTSVNVNLPDILKKGPDLTSLLAFVAMQHLGRERCPKLKLMMVGQENVGKTSVSKALMRKTGQRSKKHPAGAADDVEPQNSTGGAGASGGPNTNPALGSAPVGTGGGAMVALNTDKNLSTDGIDMVDWKPFHDEDKAKSLTFSIWDFAGQELYHTTHQFFLSKRSVFLVVFNMAAGDDASRVLFWLQSINAWAEGSPIILVGTHLDEVSSDRVVQIEADVMSKYGSAFPGIKGFVPVSCRHGGKNISRLLKTVRSVAEATDSFKESLPRSFFMLDALVTAQRDMQTPPVIRRSDIRALAKSCLIDDQEIPHALLFLKELGSLLYFGEGGETESGKSDPSGLGELVILDPQWLTKLMATLITSKPNFVKQGIVTEAGLDQIWRAPDFPQHLHPALLALLEKFEICFALPNADGYLVSSLLSPHRPRVVCSLQVPPRGVLCRVYRFSFLPFFFFSRLMIRVLHFMEPVDYWRTGILAYQDNTKVLLEYVTHTSTAALCVRVWGAHPARFLRYLMETIEVLLKGWYKVRHSIWVPCGCDRCVLARVIDSTERLDMRPKPIFKKGHKKHTSLDLGPIEEIDKSDDGEYVEGDDTTTDLTLTHDLMAEGSLKVVTSPIQRSRPRKNTINRLSSYITSSSKGRQRKDGNATDSPPSPMSSLVISPGSSPSSVHVVPSSGDNTPPPGETESLDKSRWMKKISSVTLFSASKRKEKHPANLAESNLPASYDSPSRKLPGSGITALNIVSHTRSKSSASQLVLPSRIPPAPASSNSSLTPSTSTPLSSPVPPPSQPHHPPPASPSLTTSPPSIVVSSAVTSPEMDSLIDDSALRPGLDKSVSSEIIMSGDYVSESESDISPSSSNRGSSLDLESGTVPIIMFTDDSSTWAGMDQPLAAHKPPHMYRYEQCEQAALEGKTTLNSAEHAPNEGHESERSRDAPPVILDDIVPELTLADLGQVRISFEDLEIKEKLAEGGFGEVFKGVLKSTGEMVAIKRQSDASYEDPLTACKEFRREVWLSYLHSAHPCMVGLRGCTLLPRALIMEFMPNGTLHDFLRKHGGPDLRHESVRVPAARSWQVRLHMGRNIAQALAYMHGQRPRILHRDLKSPNILLCDANTWAALDTHQPDNTYEEVVVCKVSDFGESRVVATSGQGRENLGNPLWLAPEIMNRGEYTEKADVFSLAIILWELLTGREPYSDHAVSTYQFVSVFEDAIVKGLRPIIPKECPPEYGTLLEQCWDGIPERRPTADDVEQALYAMIKAKI